MASRTDELRKRLEKDPGSRLFAQLAEELRKAGDLDEAIAVCRKGLEHHPSYPSAHMTLGRALFDKGELSDARTELESVLEGAADNILASRLLGECLEGLGAVPEAIEQYRKTLLLAPGEPRVVERLANLEAGGEPSKPMAAVPSAEEPAAAAPEAPAALAEPAEAGAQPAAASSGAPAPAGSTGEPSPPQGVTPMAAAAEPAASRPAPPPAPAAAPPPPPAAPSPGSTAAGRAVTRPGMTGKLQAQNVVAAAIAAKKAKQATEDSVPPEERTAEPPTPGQEPPAAPVAPPAQQVVPEAPEAASAGGAEPAEPERFPGMGDAESSLIGIHVGEISEVGTPAQDGGEIVSATLAEVHVEQGHTDEARAMYRQLLEREPGNEQARRRLDELESGAAAQPVPGDAEGVVRRQIAALERMLAGVRRG